MPALADGEACVKLNAGWGKGYSRVGAALFKLGRLEDAMKAYKDGLAVERSAALAEGLEEVEAALAAPQPLSWQILLPHPRPHAARAGLIAAQSERLQL